MLVLFLEEVADGKFLPGAGGGRAGEGEAAWASRGVGAGCPRAGGRRRDEWLRGGRGGEIRVDAGDAAPPTATGVRAPRGR